MSFSFAVKNFQAFDRSITRGLKSLDRRASILIAQAVELAKDGISDRTKPNKTVNPQDNNLSRRPPRKRFRRQQNPVKSRVSGKNGLIVIKPYRIGTRKSRSSSLYEPVAGAFRKHGLFRLLQRDKLRIREEEPGDTFDHVRRKFTRANREGELQRATSLSDDIFLRRWARSGTRGQQRYRHNVRIPAKLVLFFSVDPTFNKNSAKIKELLSKAARRSFS